MDSDSTRASGDALSNETYHCLDPDISFAPSSTANNRMTITTTTAGVSVERTKTFTRRKLESEYRSISTFTKPAVKRTGTFKARANSVTSGPQQGYNNNFEYFRDLENGGSSDRLASDENLDVNDFADNDPMNSTFTLGNETIDKFNHNTFRKPSSAFQRNGGQGLVRPTIVNKSHVEPKIMPVTRRPQIPVKPASLTRIPGPRKHNF